MRLGDGDLPGLSRLGLLHEEGEDTVLERGLEAGRIGVLGESERAQELARPALGAGAGALRTLVGLPLALDRHVALVEVDLEVLLGDARDVELDLEAFLG